MKLQIALDFFDVEGAKALINEICSMVDIVEIGTPFLMKDGIKPVTEMKKAFPTLEILADLKIMDAGEYEARVAFEGGADIITVLGVSNDATIAGTVREAKKAGKKVMVDMIAVPDIRTRAAEIDKLGVDYICVHTAFDVHGSGKNPLAELQIIKKVVKDAKIAVAGGVKLETLKQILSYQPEIVVVGGAITGKTDKKAATAELKELFSV